MNVISWILGAILAGTFAFAGVTKALDLDRMRDHFGYSKRQYQLIGLSEVAGAAGVIVGLIWSKVEWVAGAAGIGMCALMLGALITHARVEDEGKKIVPAIAMFCLSIAFMIFIALR